MDEARSLQYSIEVKTDIEKAEQDMDEAMKRICGETGDFFPFEERYQWLPEIKYDDK